MISPRTILLRMLSPCPTMWASPEIWLLGSSTFGAQMAASLGVGYAFAHHISPENAMVAMRTYRSQFEPSQYLDRPYAIITAAVICAETDEEAERLASSVALAI